MTAANFALNALFINDAMFTIDISIRIVNSFSPLYIILIIPQKLFSCVVQDGTNPLQLNPPALSDYV